MIACNKVGSESDIYDGCEFDAKLEIYWDALDITEESALSIVPPSFEAQVIST